MSSGSATLLPQSVQNASNVYEALTILHRRGFTRVDLDVFEAYRDVADKPKLDRLLRNVRTVEEFVDKIATSDSDFRHAVRRPGPVAPVRTTAAPEQPSFVYKLMPFTGTITRRREVRAIELMLGKRTKNNVLVCAPAGSGKTALIEALATLRPDLGPFWRADLGSLVSGTKHRGELERRLSELFEFATRTASTIFIDEIHALARMGVAEGSINALDVLKPYLMHPDFRVLGATTPSELPFVLADPAFHRRFTVMRIAELSEEQLEAVYLGYIAGSETLAPLRELFPAVIAVVDDLALPTSRVDALIDFLEHAESYLRLYPADAKDTSSVLRDIRASYIEFQQLPEDIGGTQGGGET